MWTILVKETTSLWHVPFLVQPYSNDPKDIKNNFIHLTNYSVNKNSGEFVYNEAPGTVPWNKNMKEGHAF